MYQIANTEIREYRNTVSEILQKTGFFNEKAIQEFIKVVVDVEAMNKFAESQTELIFQFLHLERKVRVAKMLDKKNWIETVPLMRVLSTARGTISPIFPFENEISKLKIPKHIADQMSNMQSIATLVVPAPDPAQHIQFIELKFVYPEEEGKPGSYTGRLHVGDATRPYHPNEMKLKIDEMQEEDLQNLNEQKQK